MIALYPGTCHHCQRPYYPGDTILRTRHGEYVHAACTDKE